MHFESAYHISVDGKNSRNRLRTFCWSVVRPISDCLTFLCFAMVVIYQCKLQIRDLIMSLDPSENDFSSLAKNTLVWEPEEKGNIAGRDTNGIVSDK